MEPVLIGNAKGAFEMVAEAARAGEPWIGYAAIAKALRMTPSNFRAQVRKSLDWQRAVNELGATEEAQGARRGLKLPKGDI